MISIIHPSRGRAWASKQNMIKWIESSGKKDFEIIISLDSDDPTLSLYQHFYEGWSHLGHRLIHNTNRSAIDAINNAAKVANGDVLMVVSDDTEPCNAWCEYIYHEANGKTDWILKTQDGIQDWIITMPVMDRAYYNRFGYIYDPDFLHMFCDTWLTVEADISGRKLTSNLKFPHLNGSIQDDLRKRCDATWVQGEKTFIQKVKNTPVEYLNKIDDRGMKNWIRNKTGIRV